MKIQTKRTLVAFCLSIVSVICNPQKTQAQDFFSDPYTVIGKTSAIDANAVTGSANPASSGFLNREYYALTGFMLVPSLNFSESNFFSNITLAGFSFASQGSSTSIFFNPNDTTPWAIVRINSASTAGWLSIGTGYEFKFNFSEYNFSNSSLFAGIAAQPLPYLSIGAFSGFDFNKNWKAVIDAGIRPFGTNFLTLFGRFTFASTTDFQWSAGASLRPISGIELFGSYASTNTVTMGVTVRAPQNSIMSAVSADTAMSSWSNLFAAFSYENSPKNDRIVLAKNTAWVEINLKTVLMQTSFIGKTYAPVYEILNAIENMKQNEQVAGIILNLSGFQATRSVMYEIRKALSSFKASGKKIIAFIDSANIDVYALACVADSIVMDPYAQLSLEGYYMGRLYLKNALEKLGIGAREIKLFTHKTAAEQFTRSSMSDTDKEQYLAYLNTIYNDMAQAITSGRNFSLEKLNAIIDNEFIVTANKAQSIGLIDAQGRYETVQKLILESMGSSPTLQVYGDIATSLTKTNVQYNFLYQKSYEFSDTWGAVKSITIIYLDGSTDLDSGMNARRAYKLIIEASNNADAIILRVNSPGGDAVAADYIAQAVQIAKEKVPVIVSMSDVAASGGYWVSMYADKIFSTPQTITGSIGVIFSWLYDKGLTDKLGLSIDGVQKGSHADAYSGIFIPKRDLSPEEVEKAREYIKDIYGAFVQHVSHGRNIDVSNVEQIAQGRIYSGVDARAVGLVDEIGSLIDAIHEAKRAIGIKETDYVYIDEYYPELPALFMPGGIVYQVAQIVKNYFLPQPTYFDAVQIFNTFTQNKLNTSGKARAELPLEDWELLFANTYQMK